MSVKNEPANLAPASPEEHPLQSISDLGISDHATDDTSSTDGAPAVKDEPSTRGTEPSGNEPASTATSEGLPDVLAPLLQAAETQAALERTVQAEAQTAFDAATGAQADRWRARAEAGRARAADALAAANDRLLNARTGAARDQAAAAVGKAEGRLRAAEGEKERIEGEIGRLLGSARPGEAGGGEKTKDRRPDESERDYLIRTGKITPFGVTIQKAGGESRTVADITAGKVRRADVTKRRRSETGEDADRGPAGDGGSVTATSVSAGKKKGQKRQRTEVDQSDPSVEIVDSDSDAKEGEIEDDEDEQGEEENGQTEADVEERDDGDEEFYQKRLALWKEGEGALLPSLDFLTQKKKKGEPEQRPRNSRSQRQSTPPAVTGPATIPPTLEEKLLPYQITGVHWLWELYGRRSGGILADEMGLGKTVQVISIIASLHYSRQLNGPAIIVVPATVLRQWVTEFHRWWPPVRVCILHTSGSGLRSGATGPEDYDSEEDPELSSSKMQAAKQVIGRVVEKGHVLVTTYSGLHTYGRYIFPVDWAYAALDEGHRIRNPDAAVTVNCKRLRTPNRLIVSGTPMQNNLTELWSLFDFACPMRLGTLVKFKDKFEIPIRLGGYANASPLQVETAARCATALKAAIEEYLLQRTKADVAADLPKKTERVLFCKLTAKQRGSYKRFLGSSDMDAVLEGRRQALFGIDVLRKVCNHPDLVDHRILSQKHGYEYGEASKSGKLTVLAELIRLWSTTGHKTLVFAQQRITLDLIERFARRDLPAVRYVRLDGQTPIPARQRLVSSFNSDTSLTLFLLTTKVGGLGINLTSADRVVIFDPDWNPSTDVQARERAWRLGQRREVEVYRLLTAGTIEERIYKRQLFKRFLEAKVLRDPGKRAMFEKEQLGDLFKLEDDKPGDDSNKMNGAQSIETEIKTEAGYGDGSRAVVEEESHSSKVLSLSAIARHEHFDPDQQERDDTDGSQKNDGESRGGESTSKGQSHLFAALFPGQEGRSSSSSKRGIDPDILAAAAQQYADEAAEELRRAARLAAKVKPGTVTWTGVVGTGGRPVEPTIRRAPAPTGRAQGSVSSQVGQLPASRRRQVGVSDALSSRSRAGPSGTSSSSSTAGASGGKVGPSAFGELAMRIRAFFREKGGSVPSAVLISHFEGDCSTKERAAEFRDVLRLVAVLEKGGRKGGEEEGGPEKDGVRARAKMWVLKK